MNAIELPLKTEERHTEVTIEVLGRIRLDD